MDTIRMDTIKVNDPIITPDCLPDEKVDGKEIKHRAIVDSQMYDSGHQFLVVRISSQDMPQLQGSERRHGRVITPNAKLSFLIAYEISQLGIAPAAPAPWKK